jgi:hypothetical protein
MDIIQIAKFKFSHIYADYLYRKTADYERLRNLPKLTGEVGFLIGNGPSVRGEDLEKLSDRTAFCCNRFHMAYSMMSFRPTFTLCADRQVIDDFGQDIANNSEGEVILVNKTKPEIQNCTWIPHISRRRLVFKKSKLCHVTTGGGTLFTAIQLGYFLGIRKFVLYGVDHNFTFDPVDDSEDAFRSASGDNNHFIKGYRSGQKWCPPEVKLIEDSFTYADRYLRKENGFLLNATRGGHLEALERVDFEGAIQL